MRVHHTLARIVAALTITVMLNASLLAAFDGVAAQVHVPRAGVVLRA